MVLEGANVSEGAAAAACVALGERHLWCPVAACYTGISAVFYFCLFRYLVVSLLII